LCGPASFAPARAGFFLREADGVIRAHSSYLEFTLTPVAGPAQSPPPEAVLRSAAHRGGAVNLLEPRQPSHEPVLETEPHLPLRSRWRAVEMVRRKPGRRWQLPPFWDSGCWQIFPPLS
jgi:hypothetical protein